MNAGAFWGRRRSLVIAAGCACLALFTWALWPGEKEPEYQGKKLSEWILIVHRDSLRNKETPGGVQGVEAIAHIGTNAIPFLLRWMENDPPRWRRILADVKQQVSEPLGMGRISEAWIHGPCDMNQALLGFSLLNSNANGAVPRLETLVKSKNSRVASYSALALMKIGDAGLPPLLAALDDKHAANRREVADSLTSVFAGKGARAAYAVPILTRCLKDDDDEVAYDCTVMLGCLRIQADTVVPALTTCLSHSSAKVRRGAIFSLGEFGHEAGGAVQPLTECLRDLDAEVRREATKTLAKIAPGMLTNQAAERQMESNASTQ